MRFWWVNQNQTYRHEVAGGYLWSPKRKANGHPNPFYDFMREVAPGDLVFSFADTRIKALGIVASHAYEAPKPLEFGTAGAYWDRIGWRVDVRFREIEAQVRPADHMARLAPLLPEQYSPLQATGKGLQSVYLTRVGAPLANALVALIGYEARVIRDALVAADRPVSAPAQGQEEWESRQLDELQRDSTLPDTTRAAIVQARRGQGLFRRNVAKVERGCRVTGVERGEHLRASHCKPWRDASNEERLDGENGLLLTPDVDHLFDRGFITFDERARVVVSPVVDRDSLERMGLANLHECVTRPFSNSQQNYLDYHRNEIFLASRFMRK